MCRASGRINAVELLWRILHEIISLVRVYGFPFFCLRRDLNVIWSTKLSVCTRQWRKMWLISLKIRVGWGRFRCQVHSFFCSVGRRQRIVFYTMKVGFNDFFSHWIVVDCYDKHMNRIRRFWLRLMFTSVWNYQGVNPMSVDTIFPLRS